MGQIDLDDYEYIIALNSTFNDVYLASIVDATDPKYIHNIDVRQYLQIIFDFFKKRTILPSTAEVKTYLTTPALKDAYIRVVTKFQEYGDHTLFNPEELIENTQTFLRERAVFHAIKDSVDEITEKKEIVSSEVFARFDTACNLSIVNDLGFDYFNQVDRHIADLTTVDRHISTGYKWFDKMLGGGLLQGGRALYTFSGPTNSGKSIVLGNIGANLVQQDCVVVVLTLEMPEMVYAKRISSKLTNINIGSLKHETDLLKQSIDQMRVKYPRSRLIIKEFPPNTISVSTVRAYLTQLVQKKKVKIDAVIVDYLTLLQAINVTGNLYGDGKAISEQLRALSYPLHFSCPFISAVQANRSAYDVDNPQINTTGESMGIAHTTDFQAAIWSTDEDKELGLIKMGIQKSRFGPNHGVQAFKIDYNTLSITETEDTFGDAGMITGIGNSLEALQKSK